MSGKADFTTILSFSAFAFALATTAAAFFSEASLACASKSNFPRTFKPLISGVFTDPFPFDSLSFVTSAAWAAASAAWASASAAWASASAAWATAFAAASAWACLALFSTSSAADFSAAFIAASDAALAFCFSASSANSSSTLLDLATSGCALLFLKILRSISCSSTSTFIAGRFLALASVMFSRSETETEDLCAASLSSLSPWKFPRTIA